MRAGGHVRIRFFASIAACLLALPACNAAGPDVEQLIEKLSAAGMKISMDPQPLPPGMNPADFQDIAQMNGVRLEYLVVDGAKVTVLRFKNEAAAKSFQEFDREKKAKTTPSNVPQWKPTTAEGRVKNFVLTLYAGASEDEAALQAKLAHIEKTLAR